MRASDAMLLHIVHNRSAIDDLEKVDFGLIAKSVGSLENNIQN